MVRQFPVGFFLFFAIRFWLLSQPIVDVLRPQSKPRSRPCVLLGMRSPALRVVPNAKIRLSTGAVGITADYTQNPTQKI